MIGCEDRINRSIFYFERAERSEIHNSSIVNRHSSFAFTAIPSRVTGWRYYVMLLLWKPDFLDLVFAIMYTDDRNAFHGHTAGS